MTNEQAIKLLVKMKASEQRMIDNVRRKRSWRPSEQAMTIASINEDIEAIDLAIKSLSQ